MPSWALLYAGMLCREDLLSNATDLSVAAAPLHLVLAAGSAQVSVNNTRPRKQSLTWSRPHNHWFVVLHRLWMYCTAPNCTMLSVAPSHVDGMLAVHLRWTLTQPSLHTGW